MESIQEKGKKNKTTQKTTKKKTTKAWLVNSLIFHYSAKLHYVHSEWHSSIVHLVKRFGPTQSVPQSKIKSLCSFCYLEWISTICNLQKQHQSTFSISTMHLCTSDLRLSLRRLHCSLIKILSNQAIVKTESYLLECVYILTSLLLALSISDGKRSIKQRAYL